MSLSSFFSSFLNVVHADAAEKEEVAKEEIAKEEVVVVEATQTEEVEQAAVVEEEEEEAEDVSAIHTTCSFSPLMFFSTVAPSNP